MVTATGFQKYTANGVVLDVAQKIRVDVPLTVGAVTEEIVVTGESVAQVETTVVGHSARRLPASRSNSLS